MLCSVMIGAEDVIKDSPYYTLSVLKKESINAFKLINKYMCVIYVLIEICFSEYYENFLSFFLW